MDLLLEGNGIPRQQAEAVMYFKLPANQGDAESQLKFGYQMSQKVTNI
jgi:TPR repeat protein